MTKSVTKAEFEQQSATLIADVVENGDEVVITTDGKAIAKLVAMENVAPNATLRGMGVMRGRAEILGDIVAPLDVEWDAMK